MVLLRLGLRIKELPRLREVIGKRFSTDAALGYRHLYETHEMHRMVDHSGDQPGPLRDLPRGYIVRFDMRLNLLSPRNGYCAER